MTACSQRYAGAKTGLIAVLARWNVPDNAAEGWELVPSVTTDNVHAMHDLIMTLADAGYKDMVHIAG